MEAALHMEAGTRSQVEEEEEEYPRWMEEELDYELCVQEWTEYSKDSSLSPVTHDSSLCAQQVRLPAHGSSSPDTYGSSLDTLQDLLHVQ